MTRVCLRAAGAAFEDARLTFPEWATVKASGMAPLGQLPVLEVDGAAYTQSLPMSVYAAKLAGLYPTEPLAAFKADEVVAVVDEAWNKIAATSKDKPETRVAYGEEVAPKYLALLEKRLGGAQFFGGAAPNYADLWVYVYVSFFASGFFDHVKTDFVERHAPAIAALVARVKESELYKKHGTPE